MSRSKHFITAILTGYTSLGVNVLCTLASVPLALHYLTKQEFGLWALITQLSGYLLLLEFGMSSSVARFLSDHKDDINGGEYGSVLNTGFRVFLIQGTLVATLGFLAAKVGPTILALPPHLHSVFTKLAALQALLTGISLATRATAAPLWPHQRNDVSNLAASLSLIVSLITLWLCYYLGLKLFSLVIASAAGSLASIVASIIACQHLRLYPQRGSWGKFDNAIFRRMLHYGSDLFMLNLGFQLIASSQIIVISRTLGLESATTWSIATKLGTMAQQFVMKIFDSSAAGLTELLVRNENKRLLARFQDVFALTSVLAAVVAGGITLFNGVFINFWTSGKISWPENNNLLMGAVVFFFCLTRCHIGLICLHKNLAGMKYATIGEGVLFIVAALIFGRTYGLPAILAASTASNLLVTGWYALARSALYFDLSFVTVGKWIAKPTALLLFGAILHQIFNLEIISNQSSFINISLRGYAFISYLCMAWIFVVPLNLKKEIQNRLRNALNSKIS